MLTIGISENGKLLTEKHVAKTNWQFFFYKAVTFWQICKIWHYLSTLAAISFQVTNECDNMVAAVFELRQLKDTWCKQFKVQS